MSRLKGKIALITGGNSGIGLATAADFLKEGAEVIITGRRQEALEEAKQVLGPLGAGAGLHTLLSDTAKMEDIHRLNEAVQGVVEGIDVLFLNAGIVRLGPVEAVTEAEFDELFNTNFKGAFFTIQQLLPLLRPGCSIILNSSVNAHIGLAGTSVLSATKAALNTLARTLSAELVGRGIRVNIISPGPVATPVLEKAVGPGKAKELAGAFQQHLPVGRFGRAEEIARIATFFASDDSSFVLGAELIADGGMTTL